MSDSQAVFWAAFGGAAAAGVFTLIVVLAAEWFRWYIDRPMLKVEARLGRIGGGRFAHTGPSVSSEVLFLEARNPHTKPVTVSSFGLLYKSKESPATFIVPQNPDVFPFQVEGGKSLIEWASVSILIENLRNKGLHPSDIKGLWFKTSSGKEFQERVAPEVIRQLEELFIATTNS